MSRLDDKVLSLSPGAKLELYEVDLTPLGGGILRFTPNREDLTPEQVTRVTDTATNNTYRRMFLLAGNCDVGETILVDGYMRQVGTGYFPAFVVGAEPTGQTNRTRIPLNLSTLATSVSHNLPIIGDVLARLSPAAEFVYFALRFTVTVQGPVYLILNVAAGTTYPTFGNAAMGAVDLFGLRAAYVTGGTRIPIIIPDDGMASWMTGNTGTTAQAANTAQAVKVPVWGGNTYAPIPIQATGYDKSGTGPFPRPKLRMSNLFNEGSALAQEYGDMRGAVVTRRVLYADHLDNGPDPDPAAFYPPDIFLVDRKSLQNSQVIEWELASVLDQQGVSLPGRQILRDVCPFTYRVWNGSSFVYASDNGCPYTGSAMFDLNGEPVTNPAEDRCSHRLKTGCRKRYGVTQEIPFGGFPMVGRLRQ